MSSFENLLSPRYQGNCWGDETKFVRGNVTVRSSSPQQVICLLFIVLLNQSANFFRKCEGFSQEVSLEILGCLEISWIDSQCIYAGCPSQ